MPKLTNQINEKTIKDSEQKWKVSYIYKTISIMTLSGFPIACGVH